MGFQADNGHRFLGIQQEISLSQTFGISQVYLVYFKKQCGETIQQFITSYRMRLIEWRLKFSDLRINELADEFGFADGIHF